jgi:creatinine amidohydrolase
VWNGRGHGGELETSVMLSIRPDYVKMIFAKGVVPDLPEHVQIKWLFRELTNTGSTGDPTKGTKEKGSSARRVLVECLVDFLKKMDQKDWKYESF